MTYSWENYQKINTGSKIGFIIIFFIGLYIAFLWLRCSALKVITMWQKSTMLKHTTCTMGWKLREWYQHQRTIPSKIMWQAHAYTSRWSDNNLNGLDLIGCQIFQAHYIIFLFCLIHQMVLVNPILVGLFHIH